MYTRSCPSCDKEIIYKTKAIYKQAIKRNSKCSSYCKGLLLKLDGKICADCKIEKNKSEFNNKKSNKDGLQYMCRDCQKISNKRYYNSEYHKNWETENKER